MVVAVKCPKCGREGVLKVWHKKSNSYHYVYHRGGEICYLGPENYKINKNRTREETLLGQFTTLTETFVWLRDAVNTHRELDTLAPTVSNYMNMAKTAVGKMHRAVVNPHEKITLKPLYLQFKCPKCGREGTPEADVRNNNVYYRVYHNGEMCYLGAGRRGVDTYTLLIQHAALLRTMVRLVKNTVTALRRPSTLDTEDTKRLKQFAPTLERELCRVYNSL